jgi:hypothetical protein
MEEGIPLPLGTGAAIRDYLLMVGVASPYDFYKEFKKVKPTTSYESIRRYFYIARKLGLIRLVRTEPSSKGGFSKRFYELVPGAEHDPRWEYLQIAYYPITGFGGRHGKRYKRWVEMGKPMEELVAIKRRHRV